MPKFLHCADLHLGSPLASLPEGLAATRRAELAETLSRIAALGAREGVRAILLAGDLFDSDSPSPATVAYLLDTVRAYPALDFLLLYGNHAGGYRIPEDRLPSNLRTFPEHELGAVSYGDVTVFACEDPQVSVPALPKLGVNLLMLHGSAVERAGARDDLSLAALRARNIDYLALGHYHSYRAEPLDGEAVFCYPGCPEPRGFDETGRAGVVLLDTEGGRVSHRLIELARRRYHDLTLDMSESTGAKMSELLLDAALEGIPETDAVRLHLTGKLRPPYVLDPRPLEVHLRGRFFHMELLDETGVALSPDDLAGDLSLAGEYLRTVRERGLDPECEALVLRVGLAAIAGEELPI